MNTYIDVTKLHEKRKTLHYDQCHWMIFTACDYHTIEVGVDTAKALQAAGLITDEQLQQLELQAKCERAWMGVHTHVVRLKRASLLHASEQLATIAEKMVRNSEDPSKLVIRADGLQEMWESGLLSYLANYTTGGRLGDSLIFDVLEVDIDTPIDFYRILESAKKPMPPRAFNLLPAIDAADTPKA